MRFSRTLGYAICGLVYIAGSPPHVAVSCRALAQAGQMPERFLLQILRVLVRKGLLRSVRGVRGGYALARAADQISMLDIIEAIEGPFAVALPETQIGGPALTSGFERLNQQLREAFTSLRLSALVDARTPRELPSRALHDGRESGSDGDHR